MVYYLGYFFVLGSLQLISLLEGKKHIKNSIIMGLACLITIFFQGFRAPSVGTDLASYLPAYEEFKKYTFWEVFTGKTLYNFEWGYALYNVVLGKVGFSSQAFLLITSAIINIPIVYTILKTEPEYPLLLFFIYATMGVFAFNFSGIRQSIAISITFLSFLSIKRRQFLKFFIWIVIACLFHKTAIIFIFAYPAYHLKIRKNLYAILFLFLVFFVLLFNEQIVQLAYLIVKGETVNLTDTNAYAFFCGLLFVWGFVWFTEDKLQTEKNEIYKLTKLLAIAVLIQALAPVHNYIARLGYYYYIYIIFLVPPYLRLIQDNALKAVLIILMVILLIAYFYYSISGNVLSLLPYKFFWQ